MLIKYYHFFNLVLRLLHTLCLCIRRFLLIRKTQRAVDESNLLNKVLLQAVDKTFGFLNNRLNYIQG